MAALYRYTRLKSTRSHGEGFCCCIPITEHMLHCILPGGCYGEPVSPGTVRPLTPSCQSHKHAGPVLQPLWLAQVCVCVVKQWNWVSWRGVSQSATTCQLAAAPKSEERKRARGRQAGCSTTECKVAGEVIALALVFSWNATFTVATSSMCFLLAAQWLTDILLQDLTSLSELYPQTALCSDSVISHCFFFNTHCSHLVAFTQLNVQHTVIVESQRWI